MTAKVNMIVAVDKYGGFGKGGKIPWSFKEDFEFFKKKTHGYSCLLGKNTYLDIVKMSKKRNKNKNPDEVLPGREVFVLSSDEKLKIIGKNVTRVSSVEQFLYNHSESRVFICGGERLYKQCLSLSDTIFMTVVDGDFQCDRYFPVELLSKNFKIHKGDTLKSMDRLSKLEYNLYFLTYVR